MSIFALQSFIKKNQLPNQYHPIIELPKPIIQMEFCCIYNNQVNTQQKALLTQVAGVLKAAMKPFALSS